MLGQLLDGGRQPARALRADRRPQLQPSPRRSRRSSGAARGGARYQHRHLLDAARAVGIPARSVDGGDARRSTSTDGGSTCGRISPSRARASRPGSSTSAIPDAAARSRWSSRSSSWTSGPACPTREELDGDAAVRQLHRGNGRAAAAMNRQRREGPGEPFVPDFGPKGSLRQPVGDRRASPRRPVAAVHHPASRRCRAGVAWPGGSRSKAPAYLVWSPDDDAAALAAVEAVVAAMASRSGRLLVISLDDRPWSMRRRARRLARLRRRSSARATRATSAGRPSALETAIRDDRASTFAIARSSGCRSHRCCPQPFDRLLDRHRWRRAADAARAPNPSAARRRRISGDRA